MNTTWIAAGVAVSVLAGPAGPDQDGPVVTIERLMEHLGFNASEKDALLNGKVLYTGNPDMEQRKSELAVSGAMLVVRLPLPVVVNAYMDGEVFRVQTGMSAFHEIDPSATSPGDVGAAFAGLGYNAKETGEARKIVGFKGGEAFNLSDDEIARFRRINARDPELVETVSATWREVLAARYRAYRESGLDAIEPYRRGSRKTSSPSTELTVATASFDLLRNHFPDVYDEILKFPDSVPGATPLVHRFFWLKQEVQGRPDFILVHHATDIDDRYAMIVEQQFYVGHSYNTLEAALGCVPYEHGTVVFYTSRVFTDQITGFAAGIARGIGRNQAMNSVAHELERLRTALESKQGSP